ncbi:TonB-dependent receptor [bacterium]|nr:TonB-dependent receptor [bacterium]
MNHWRRVAAVVVFSGVLLVPLMGFAANVGKIAGRIIEKGSGEGVIGANVIIVETQQGASADIDGNYVILNVSPGTYEVKITAMGYQEETHTGVVVQSDITTNLNAKLGTEAIGMEEVIVVYEKPSVQLDVVSKSTRIGAEELSMRPISSVEDVLKTLPGFKVDPEGALHVRGGRGHEALVKIDGLDVRDPLVNSGKNLLNLSAMNIEEIEVLTGGVSAEYGQFQSALINVTTPEGDVKEYSGSIEWKTDRVIDKTSFHADEYTYSMSGPVPFSEHIFGKKVTFFTTGTANLENTYTPYSIQREPNDYLGFGFDLPERQSNSYNTFWKFTYQIDPMKKLNFSWSRDFFLWDVYPDGEAAIDGNYGWQYKYNVENRPWVKNIRQSMNLKFSHQINQKTVYEVSLGNFATKTLISPRNKTPGEFTLQDDIEDHSQIFFGDADGNQNGFADGYWDANLNGVYDGDGEGYEDVNRNGRWDRGEDWVDLNNNGIYDAAEPWIDRPNSSGVNNPGVYDPWDPFIDLNGNGHWDNAEPQLPEQDWNHNGTWDGERFQDANNNGVYDGWGEGYDDMNLNGSIDKQMLFTDNEDSAEPFNDGDFFYDTGEPFIDTPDSNGYYNGEWDEGEIYFDLPSSFQAPFYPRYQPTRNGRYDGPNYYFDEYELFCQPASQAYGMDPTMPVIYSGGLPQLLLDASQDPWWLNLPRLDNGDQGYLAMIPDWSTWTNRTLNDENEPIFDIPNNAWDAGEEWFGDYNSNGMRDANEDEFLNPDQWDANSFWQDRSSNEYSLKFDVTSQVNKYHEVKSGAELKYRQLEMQSIEAPDLPYNNPDVPLPAGSPWPDRGDVRDFYDRKPWEGAFYFQDKMEFEGMIVRAGVRLDFVIQDPNLTEETQRLLDVSQPGALLAERGRYRIAPRLGISHPVSERAKLYFNYGHFFQTPSFEYFYRSATANISPNTTIGNPNLDYEKTVQYELGVNTQVGELLVFDVAGYYRDIYNQIGTVEERIGPVTLNRYFNLGYARARGFEFSFERKYSNNWYLKFNYDYSYAYGKESASAEGLQQRLSNVPENRDEHPLDWDETHTVSAFLTVDVRETDHPKPFGISIPNDWLMTVEFDYGSGLPYTPTNYLAGMSTNRIASNSYRLPWTETTNLKFDKHFRWSGLVFTIGTEIYNLWDKRNWRAVYTDTGNPYDSTNPANPDNSLEDPYNTGTDYDHNPRNLYPPRQVYLHFKVAF